MVRYDFVEERLERMGQAPRRVLEDLEVPQVRRGVRDRFDRGAGVYEQMNQGSEYEIYTPALLED